MDKQIVPFRISEGNANILLYVKKLDEDVLLKVMTFYQHQKKKLKDLAEILEERDSEIEQLKRENAYIKKRNVALMEEVTIVKDTHSKQLDVIKQLKIDNSNLTARIQQKRGNILTDQELLKWFNIEYQGVCDNIEEIKDKIQYLRKTYEELKYKHIVSYLGNERMKLVIKLEAVEHEIKNYETRFNDCLLEYKSKTMWKSLMDKQTPSIRVTMIKLGWLDTTLSTEYRLGLLYDVARLHNNRELLAFTDKLVEKCSKLTSAIKVVQKPFIPIRSQLSRASLCIDSNAKDMSHIDLPETSLMKKMLIDLTISPDVDPDIKYPKLPSFKTFQQDSQDTEVSPDSDPCHSHDPNSDSDVGEYTSDC